MYIFGSLSKSTIQECRSIGMSSDEIEKYSQYVTRLLNKEKMGGRNGRRDSDQSKVYQSEWAMQRQVNIRQFKTVEAAEKRMNQIQNSKLWEKLAGKKVYLVSNTRMGRATAGRAHYGGKIELGTTGMNEYTLIHEMAHQLPNCMHHSVQFRINLVKLVSRFMGTDVAKILKAEFKERKLKMSVPAPRSPESWFKSYTHMKNVRAKL